MLNITLHKKCFLAFFSYNNESIDIGKKSKCCLYIEVGLHWQAYQMDVNLRRTSNLYKNQPWKNGPKAKVKRGEPRTFYIQLYIWRVLRFEVIGRITKFQKQFRGSVIFNKVTGLQLQLQWKNIPLEVFLRFCIRANGLKS